MVRDLELGKTVFNGTVVFLGVSFGFFNLAFSSNGLYDPSLFKNTLLIGILVTVFLLSGLAALILSYLGIRLDEKAYSDWAFISFILLIIFTAIIYLILFNNQINISLRSISPTI